MLDTCSRFQLDNGKANCWLISRNQYEKESAERSQSRRLFAAVNAKSWNYEWRTALVICFAFALHLILRPTARWRLEIDYRLSSISIILFIICIFLPIYWLTDGATVSLENLIYARAERYNLIMHNPFIKIFWFMSRDKLSKINLDKKCITIQYKKASCFFYR